MGYEKALRMCDAEVIEWIPAGKIVHIAANRPTLRIVITTNVPSVEDKLLTMAYEFTSAKSFDDAVGAIDSLYEDA